MPVRNVLIAFNSICLNVSIEESKERLAVVSIDACWIIDTANVESNEAAPDDTELGFNSLISISSGGCWTETWPTVDVLGSGMALDARGSKRHIKIKLTHRRITQKRITMQQLLEESMCVWFELHKQLVTLAR